MGIHTFQEGTTQKAAAIHAMFIPFQFTTRLVSLVRVHY